MLTRQTLGMLTLVSLVAVTDSPATAGEVVLTRQEHSVVVRINGEVSCALTVDPHWKKPFILPVAVGESWDILAENLANPPADEHAAGTQLFVVTEGAELRVLDTVRGEATFSEVLTAGDVRDGYAYIPDREAWISLSDVVPVAAMVTRIVHESPQGGLHRDHPLYYDHPHHKGVWCTLDEVNGLNYWGEVGVVRNEALDLLQESGNPAVLRMVNHWLGSDGRPLLIETTTVQFHADRLYVFDIRLQAGDSTVTLGDTKEGMLAIRLPNSMREFTSGGPVVNAEGVTGTAACWGKTSPWIDYVGQVDGRTFGVTLMDHPENFRPSRYHVRDYGLFSINPFGEHTYTNGALPEEDYVLAPGEFVQVRYGLFVHRGETGAAGVTEAYERFLTLAPADEGA